MELPRGTTLGRYIVVDRLGAGAMGVVYRAYDPELDRTVALKLLRERGDDDARTARLQREAQAMARLSHRNVVAVFDVGRHQQQLFVAMEHLDGRTLRAWLGEARRGWRETVEVFLDAGRGLAAAHSAGVIHRDFKPDNVLITHDGRVVVVDFGVAGAPGEREIPPGVAPRAPSSATATGALLGTPAYMAPELWRGDRADERSDQFAFSVALHEALFGEPPFAPTDGDDTLDDADRLALAILAGEVRPPPAEVEVPARVRRVVARGLATAPDERFPSMTALLAALDDTIRRRRPRWIAAGAAGVAIAAAAGLYAARDRRAGPTCSDARARLVGAWDPAVRSRIAEAWRATGRRDADQVLDLAAARLDAYADAWTAGFDDACAASRIRGEQSAELFDLRADCLLDRRGELEALTTVLAEDPDRALLDRAVQAIGRLEPVDRCADVAALRAADPPPRDPERAAQVATVTAEVARAEALTRAARFADARLLAEQAARDAASIGYATLQARALVALGDVYESLDLADAEPTLDQATLSAADAGDDDLFARALLLHMRVLSDARRFDEASALAPVARAVSRRAHDRGRLDAGVLLEEALIAQGRERYEDARARFADAIAAYREATGDDDERVAVASAMLAAVEYRLGHLDEAVAAATRAADVLERLLGPNHPKVASARTVIGGVALQRTDLPAAAREMERAAAIYEIALGPDHLDTASAYNNVGLVYQMQGRYDEAAAALSRALAIKRARLGDDAPEVATELANHADILRSAGDIDRAVAELRESLAIRERALGPDSPDLADSARLLAVALIEQGHADEAVPLAVRAVEIRTRALGDDHPELMRDLDAEGRALWASGAAARAVPVLERAVAGAEKLEMSDFTLSNLRFDLARALWDGGGDRGRAIALAELALEARRRAGTEDPEDIAAVAAWLEGHRR